MTVRSRWGHEAAHEEADESAVPLSKIVRHRPSTDEVLVARPEGAAPAIGRDQVEDYARRTDVSPEVIERRLSTSLGY